MYKECTTFTILGKLINLFSDETCYGLNTVAEIDDRYHYLGSEYPAIAAAIFAWQEINGRDLTDDELHQIMLDNNLISAGI